MSFRERQRLMRARSVELLVGSKKIEFFGQPLDGHHLLDLLNRIIVEIAFYK